MRGPINRIIICGGGSAGWMTAAVLSNQFPDKEIALVESPDIPVVGVGESTLGTINSYLTMLGLEDKDWMAECQATYKLGIKFTNNCIKIDALIDGSIPKLKRLKTIFSPLKKAFKE